MQHIDIIMYYLRRNLKFSTEIMMRVSTTDCSLSKSVVSMYDNFQKNSDAYKIDSTFLAMKIMKGEILYCGSHWKDLEHVVFFVHVQVASHWLLLHFDVLIRSLTVYDSMSGPRHEVYTLPVAHSFSVMIPLMLEAIDFYS